MLAVELSLAENGALQGVLVLPFGLHLPEGVGLQVDSRAAEPRLPFLTCLPVGCIVALSFDAEMIGRLRGGRAVNIDLAVQGQTQSLALIVPLYGFTAALENLAGIVAP